MDYYTVFSIKLLVFYALIQIARAQTTSDCGIEYSCVLIPENCIGSSCDFVYKWRNSNNTNTIDFVLSANIGSFEQKWAAIGFSKDQSMGDDSVVVCKTTNAVQPYYNTWRSPNYVDDSNPTYGIFNPLISYDNNWLTCSFSRLIKSDLYETFFDLSQSYYVLAATGRLNSDGSLIQHTKQASSSSVVLFSPMEYVITSMGNLRANVNLAILFTIALLSIVNIYLNLI